jgi:hypothetical protein
MTSPDADFNLDRYRQERLQERAGKAIVCRSARLRFKSSQVKLP